MHAAVLHLHNHDVMSAAIEERVGGSLPTPPESKAWRMPDKRPRIGRSGQLPDGRQLGRWEGWLFNFRVARHPPAIRGKLQTAQQKPPRPGKACRGSGR
jgi:hypothetical protein